MAMTNTKVIPQSIDTILTFNFKRIRLNTPQKALSLICKLPGVSEKRVGCEFDKNEREQSATMSSHGH